MAQHGLRPFGNQTPWLVIASPDFHDVAVNMIASAPSGSMELASVKWRLFPDGTPNVMFDASAIEGRDVLFLGSQRERHLLSFFSVAYAIPRCLARTFTVVTPYFPTGTMERVEKEGEVATAKTLARMMSATPSPQVGESTYVFYDMHALATRFYFNDSVKVLFVTAVPLLKKQLAENTQRTGKKPVIAFPDEGARKRFGRYFRDEYELALCIKTRVGDRREVTLQEGNVKNREVYIIDDLVQSGGTLSECKDLLYREGAESVGAYVTHGVFPNDSWKRFLIDNTPAGKQSFSTFFITDSIPKTAMAVENQAPFKVLSIAPHLASLLVGPRLQPSKL